MLSNMPIFTNKLYCEGNVPVIFTSIGIIATQYSTCFPLKSCNAYAYAVHAQKNKLMSGMATDRIMELRNIEPKLNSEKILPKFPSDLMGSTGNPHGFAENSILFFMELYTNHKNGNISVAAYTK